MKTIHTMKRIAVLCLLAVLFSLTLSSALAGTADPETTAKTITKDAFVFEQLNRPTSRHSSGQRQKHYP